MREPVDLIVHHADCADGVCAAWVAKQHSPSAQILAAKYGDPAPDVRGLRVAVVDFHYPRVETVEMASQAKSFVCLDHHKTAAAALAGIEGCVFAQNKSGARMAQDYFFGSTLWWFVAYVEDRDLWRWRLPDSREFSAGLRSYPMTFETFDRLASPVQQVTFETLVADGRAILRYQRQVVEAAVKRARPEWIAGVAVPTVESTTLKDEIGEALSEGVPFAAIWSMNERGERVYSLRSRESGLDVTEIAQQFPGGGGHARAAGFTVKQKTTSLTLDEAVAACKNIGYDLTCGACAEMFFTGACLHAHDATCTTPVTEVEQECPPPDGSGAFFAWINKHEARWPRGCPELECAVCLGKRA